jgi:hypothetical protein
VERGGVLKRAYRCVLDWLEEWTTGCAHLVLVNSSKNEFKRHFLLLFNKYVLLHMIVTYPLVHKLPASPSCFSQNSPEMCTAAPLSTWQSDRPPMYAVVVDDDVNVVVAVVVFIVVSTAFA